MIRRSGSCGCATPQYKINGDGTVTDNQTGLVWQQVVPSGTYGPLDAQSYCQNLNLGGTGAGWRLPTLSELFSLVDLGSAPPYIDSAAFPNTPPAAFWTAGPPYDAIDFSRGSEGGNANYNAVRCVISYGP